MAHNNHFGRLGEDLAVDLLKNNNYIILERNYRYQRAEIDIIALKGSTLVIIEVKARSFGHLGDIAETVSAKKIALLVMAADEYVTKGKMEVEIRFDIITIRKVNNKHHLDHIEDAFYYF